MRVALSGAICGGVGAGSNAVRSGNRSPCVVRANSTDIKLVIAASRSQPDVPTPNGDLIDLDMFYGAGKDQVSGSHATLWLSRYLFQPRWCWSFWGVGQSRSQASDLVVLVVNPSLQVRNTISQGLVLMLNHIICEYKKFKLECDPEAMKTTKYAWEPRHQVICHAHM